MSTQKGPICVLQSHSPRLNLDLLLGLLAGHSTLDAECRPGCSRGQSSGTAERLLESAFNLELPA